jgi:uncharacterized protein YjdB
MKMRHPGTLIPALAMGLAWFAATGGCDSTGSGTSILVEPSSATLRGAEAVTFTAVVSSNNTLVLPLTWTVSNPALGNVIGKGGVTAVYESNGTRGNNTISVLDEGTGEGVVLVTQQ